MIVGVQLLCYGACFYFSLFVLLDSLNWIKNVLLTELHKTDLYRTSFETCTLSSVFLWWKVESHECCGSERRSGRTSETGHEWSSVTGYGVLSGRRLTQGTSLSHEESPWCFRHAWYLYVHALDVIIFKEAWTRFIPSVKAPQCFHLIRHCFLLYVLCVGTVSESAGELLRDERDRCTDTHSGHMWGHTHKHTHTALHVLHQYIQVSKFSWRTNQKLYSLSPQTLFLNIFMRGKCESHVLRAGRGDLIYHGRITEYMTRYWRVTEYSLQQWKKHIQWENMNVQ